MDFDLEVQLAMIELRNELQQRAAAPTYELSAWAVMANTKLKLLLESGDISEGTRADVEDTRKTLMRAVLGVHPTKEGTDD